MGSRSHTDAESRYSNISERERLAVMFSLTLSTIYSMWEAYSHWNSPLTTRTDISLRETLQEAQARLQRLLLRCMKFLIEVTYRQGETIPVADALSYACATTKVTRTGHQSESCAPDYSVHFMTDTSYLMPLGHWSPLQWKTQGCSCWRTLFTMDGQH